MMRRRSSPFWGGGCSARSFFSCLRSCVRFLCASSRTFALAIAVIGVRMGMTVGRDTRALGAAATSGGFDLGRTFSLEGMLSVVTAFGKLLGLMRLFQLL